MISELELVDWEEFHPPSSWLEHLKFLSPAFLHPPFLSLPLPIPILSLPLSPFTYFLSTHSHHTPQHNYKFTKLAFQLTPHVQKFGKLRE